MPVSSRFDHSGGAGKDAACRVSTDVHGTDTQPLILLLERSEGIENVAK